jgi:glycosyltransferase involved in cell wall biosynthesis
VKVALSAIGTFHTFDLAREMHARGSLAGILTGYPRFKLRAEDLPPELIHTFPFVHALRMAFPWRRLVGSFLEREIVWLDTVSFGAYAAHVLPDCDVYVGLSGTSLAAGKRAQSRGARYICDRGSSHIRAQDELLREEFARWGEPFKGIDPRVVDAEEAEYAAADRITVPSGFVQRTFLAQGVAPEKLRKLPYGVNLSRFGPDGTPAEGRFGILFVGGMSLRKGVQYLVQAFEKFDHPGKSLTFVGAVDDELIEMLRARKLWPEEARVLGHVPQSELKTLMSRSHVMVLPSVEEGLALVVAQAMACGCPVIATTNTGAEDILADGAEGFIVPIRDVDALAERLQHMADNPDERAAMGERALAKVQGLGGWHAYGENAMAVYKEAVAKEALAKKYSS